MLPSLRDLGKFDLLVSGLTRTVVSYFVEDSGPDRKCPPKSFAPKGQWHVARGWRFLPAPGQRPNRNLKPRRGDGSSSFGATAAAPLGLQVVEEATSTWGWQKAPAPGYMPLPLRGRYRYARDQSSRSSRIDNAAKEFLRLPRAAAISTPASTKVIFKDRVR